MLPNKNSSNVIKKSALAPTVLISGGAGFIGSHLAEILLQKEARVIVLDNFKTGKEIHVKHLLNNPKFALFDVDINDGLPQDIESVDYIFHLAGLEEYLYSKNELDLDSLLTNALGTKNLLDLAKRSEAKFLLASTIDVYEGRMSQFDLDNYFGKTDFDEKKYTLTEAKRYAEALVWEYFKKNNTDARIVRLPEVYGPRMSLDSSGYLGQTLKDLIDGRPITVRDSGVKKEFYLYVTDAVSGMIKALLNDNTKGSIFSLIPKEPISTLEIAYLVRSVADRVVEIKFEGDDSAAIPNVHMPDTYSLIYLKWDAKTSFKDGIIQTLRWFGYNINQHSFKSSKLIEQKNTFSWLDLKPQMADQLEQPFVTAQIQENYNTRKINTTKEIPKIRKFKLPRPHLPKLKFSLPRISLSLPKFSLPKFNFSSGSVGKKVELDSFGVVIKDSSGISITGKIIMFFIVVISFILVFVAFPGYQVYSSVMKGKQELDLTADYISKFDSIESAYRADLAVKEFTKATKYISSLDWVFKVTGNFEQYKSITKFLKSITYFSKSAYNISVASDPLKDIWTTLKPEASKSFNPASLETSKVNLQSAQSNIQIAKAEFDSIDAKYLPENVRSSLSSYRSILDSAEKYFGFAETALAELPGLMGFDGPKKYIVLFQNNNEIRPTGGFIGSYAVLYMKDGKIEELTIDDIYNPDGQLDIRNINVTPPGPIRDYLKEDKLYIRNANWSPDFSQSAKAIKDLFFKLNGENIDGVFAVDLNVASRLLEVTGPIFLTAYNEQINADNLYERTQYHSSYNYQEGSQQKRQFLTLLGSKLLESLFALEQDKTKDLALAVVDSLQSRHISIYLESGVLSTLFDSQGWTGNLVRTSEDYLQIVNANLGGTKSNYYVDQEYAYKVMSKTRDGLLRAQLELEYTHNGTDESWPGGPYTDYVRVLAQKGAKLTDAEIIYDETVSDKIEEKIVINDLGPYTSFETGFVLNPQSSVKIIFYYDLSPELSVTKSAPAYNLYWQKQGGTGDDPYSFSFDIPFGMVRKDTSSILKMTDDKFFTSGLLEKDTTLYINLE